MPRIAGVDIPENKKILYSLQYVHGIGPATSKDILGKVGVDPDTRAKDLADHEVAGIAGEIDTNHVVEGALRRQVQQDIQRLKDTRCWRGERHRKGLPVRGQRTRCNARTRKGRKRTVAGKKGVKG
jgi:small subunit ribosomal protein S13